MLYRDFSSQQEIDAQYEIERSVEDPKAYADLFINGSARARAELTCLLDVKFGPTVEETIDIFPAEDPNAPILLFIHGGYWRRLSSKEFSFVARGPVERGVTTVVTNYALCPKVTISEITRQSRAVVSWIRNYWPDVAGSPDRIFVSGHSAGGHQVARLLSTDWAGDYGLPDDVIKGGYSISGLFDLTPLRFSYLQPMIQLTQEIIDRESPMFAIPERAPPLVASVGALESPEFRRQSADYMEHWTAAGLRGEYIEQAGKNHYSAIEGFGDAGSAFCRRLMEFIASC